MDELSVVWLLIIALLLFCAIRSLRRQAQRRERQQVRAAAQAEAKKTEAMMAERYAPTPIAAAPEAKHWADSIPYPITPSKPVKKDQ